MDTVPNSKSLECFVANFLQLMTVMGHVQLSMIKTELCSVNGVLMGQPCTAVYEKYLSHLHIHKLNGYLWDLT